MTLDPLAVGTGIKLIDKLTDKGLYPFLAVIFLVLAVATLGYARWKFDHDVQQITESSRTAGEVKGLRQVVNERFQEEFDTWKFVADAQPRLTVLQSHTATSPSEGRVVDPEAVEEERILAEAVKQDADDLHESHLKTKQMRDRADEEFVKMMGEDEQDTERLKALQGSDISLNLMGGFFATVSIIGFNGWAKLKRQPQVEPKIGPAPANPPS